MMETPRVVEETGPDEDHQLLHRSPYTAVSGISRLQLNDISGVRSVDRHDSQIETFISYLPHLMKHPGTFGLIWDKRLQPEGDIYEPGRHFVSTREETKETTRAYVSFYRDGATGATFAIKELKAGAHFCPLEVLVGLRVQHPNICSVYGLIVRHGTLSILLEHAGSPLDQERPWIAHCPKRTRAFARQSFQALEAIHQKGFIHCDISPDNIMIQRNSSCGDSDFTVKLTNFSTCHPVGTKLLDVAHLTRSYWSPEIWQAFVSKTALLASPALDVYAMALSLHYVQTSVHLMQKFDKQVFQSLMLTAPNEILLVALPETLPSDLSAIMRSCLDGDVLTRMSATEALRHLAVNTLENWPSSHTAAENYMDSFSRMYSSMTKYPRYAKAENIPNAEVPVLESFPTFQSLPEQTDCIVPEKRELKAISKTRRQSVVGNKYGRPSLKNRKLFRYQAKLNSQKLQGPGPALSSSSSSVGSSESDVEMGVSFQPPDKDYPCAFILMNLALKAQSTHQAPTGTGSTLGKQVEKLGPAAPLVMETQQSPEVHGGGPITFSHLSTEERGPSKGKLSGNIIDRKVNSASSNRSQAANQHAKTATIINTDSLPNEITNININPLAATQLPITSPICPVPSSSFKKDNENSGDGMEFLFDVFNDVFTGDKDDILDSMINQLENLEQMAPSDEAVHLDAEKETARADPIEVDATPRVDKNICGQKSTSCGGTGCTSGALQVKGTRKRIADTAASPCGIPGKVVSLPPLLQSGKMPQLPNFDQILPEHV